MYRSITGLYIFFLLVFSHTVMAQQYSAQRYADYAEKYKDIAMRKMVEYRIPASITLAQGILESACGTSPLALEANNHFGIKCHVGWNGDTYTYDDDEKGECFRKYRNVEDSFNDHSLFLTMRPRYANLFTLDIRDYKAWARGLKAAGYATNPQYAEILIRYIEENQLYIFDDMVMSGYRMAKQEAPAITYPESRTVVVRQPEPTKDYAYSHTASGNRQIYENNGVRLIYARAGDDARSISKDLSIHSYQILKYNGLKRSDIIREGDVIYVTPKKNGHERSYHTAQPGEKMRDISQLYAVKENLLRKYNGFTKTQEPKSGDRIYLNKIKR